MSPRLDLIVGCNGAGKSSLVEVILQPLLPASVLVNADLIAQSQWPDSPEQHSYEAARIAAQTRDALIDKKRSFIAETVFSHPSKLEMIDRAHHNGFAVTTYVVMIPEDLAVARVASRVDVGGHAVPEIKIRERFHRLWPLTAEAITRSERSFVYDNSGTAMREAARFDSGRLVGTARWPTWTPKALAELH